MWVLNVAWPSCSTSARRRSVAGRGGRGIDLVNAEKVDLLELVMANLLRLYALDAAEIWLRGVNPHLGNRRPIDLIRSGETQAQAASIFQGNADADGTRWWSALESGWINSTLFDRATEKLKLESVEVLTPEDPHVREAGRFIGLL